MRLALIGGEEFENGFEAVHAALIQPLKGGKSRGVFLPTNASHDGLAVVKKWCKKSIERLSPFAGQVDAPVVNDKSTANDPKNAELLSQADWVYLGGGFPHIGMGVLRDTLVMSELYKMAERGALIIGASAGAMMMCSRSFVVGLNILARSVTPQFIDCMGLIPNSICFPHFNQTYTRRWLNYRNQLPQLKMIGLDEQTALTNFSGTWEVLGNGAVSIFTADSDPKPIRAGQPIHGLD